MCTTCGLQEWMKVIKEYEQEENWRLVLSAEEVVRDALANAAKSHTAPKP